MALVVGSLTPASAESLAASRPTVTGLSPLAGPATGQHRVVITGTGFTKATTVHFGGARATRVRFASSRQISVVAPRHALGSANVRITTTHGKSAVSSADRYRYVSTPRALRYGEPVDAGIGVETISCLSATFCAGGGDGLVVRNGSSWGAPVSVLTDVVGVSCATITFCAAIDDHGHATTYNGRNWNTPVEIDKHGALAGQTRSISCAAPSFCMAIDGNGYAVRYRNGHWSAPKRLVVYGQWTSVSCPSATFCLVVGGGGAPSPTTSGIVARYTGTWGKVQTIFRGSLFTAVSCSSSTFCQAGTDNGFYDFTGTTWSTLVHLHVARGRKSELHDVFHVSCSSKAFCTAFWMYDDYWPLLTSSDGASARTQDLPPSAQPHDEDDSGLIDMSCWATHKCAIAAGSVIRTY
jgi:hypothetical protein